MINERELGEFMAHGERGLVDPGIGQPATMLRGYEKVGVQAHIDRAALLAGQRYLRKEYGPASKVAKR